MTALLPFKGSITIFYTFHVHMHSRVRDSSPWVAAIYQFIPSSMKSRLGTLLHVAGPSVVTPSHFKSTSANFIHMIYNTVDAP